MALALGIVVPNPTSLLLSTQTRSFTSHFPSHHGRVLLRTIPCKAVSKTSDQEIVRRSANYQPPIWDYDSLQSLNTKYEGEMYARRAAKLKEDVRMMLGKTQDPLEKLELIDVVERLGLSYHFEGEIKRMMKSIYDNISYRNNWCNGRDLYASALAFRILRQHGYNVSPEVFSSFKDTSGKFKDSLCENAEGLLSLYEASYLLTGDEVILEEARDFAAIHLKEYLKKSTDPSLAMLVSHALELPQHWRMPRMEARWFIESYERTLGMNTTLLEFAKLNFNILQRLHQEDLKDISSWWESTGWREKLPFVRDRVVENYLWSLGEAFEPHFQYFRRMETRINILATCIDDVYDIYGTLDELHLFTNAVDRWDVNAVEQLPDYMKICFYGFYNCINEIAYDALKEQGVHILPYLKQKWQDLCHCYMKEAEWSRSGYVPTLEEYLNHAWTSATGPMLLTHAYVLSTSPLKNPITMEELECIENYHNIIKWPSMVARLADDLGTSWHEAQRGDIPKSIQIYMHETGATAEDATEHVKYLISEGWKKINEARFMDSPFSETFVEIATNLARVSQFMYEHGDGHGHDIGGKNNDRVTSLLAKPIPLA